jgi:hypothetical protein
VTALIRINCDAPMDAGTCGVHTHAPGTDLNEAERAITRDGWTTRGTEHRCPAHSPHRPPRRPTPTRLNTRQASP